MNLGQPDKAVETDDEQVKRGQKKFGVIEKVKPLPGQKDLFPDEADETVSPPKAE